MMSLFFLQKLAWRFESAEESLDAASAIWWVWSRADCSVLDASVSSPVTWRWQPFRGCDERETRKPRESCWQISGGHPMLHSLLLPLSASIGPCMYCIFGKKNCWKNEWMFIRSHVDGLPMCPSLNSLHGIFLMLPLLFSNKSCWPPGAFFRPPYFF